MNPHLQTTTRLALIVAAALAAPLAGAAAAAASLDQGLNWSACGPLSAPPPAAAPAAEGPIEIAADSAELFPDERLVELRGRVEIQHGETRLEADQVRYDDRAGVAEAAGGVFLQQPGLRMAGRSGALNLRDDSGRLEAAEYRLPAQRARGRATVAEVVNPELSRFWDISYSTCAPGRDDWLLEAQTLELNRAAGWGEVENARLSFMDVPILYLPWATFPIDERRKSGFLTPSAGQSSETGFDLTLPYYFNLAPNLDATLAPRLMSKRGLLLGGELRYLGRGFQGLADAEVLPDDPDYSLGNSTRGAFSLAADGRPAPGWGFDLGFRWVSDDDYLEDLGNGQAVTAQHHLERRADLRYNGPGWSLLGRLQDHQTIDPGILPGNEPYARLPQLLLALEQPEQWGGLTYRLHGEYVYFDHAEGVTGHRLDLRPGLSLPLRRSWGFIEPALSARYTAYDLQDPALGQADNPERALGAFSLDAGLIFERPAEWFGAALTQTLEPRLFYLYTPHENQDDLPVFDSAELDFGFANLFRENRFSGADRIGDANQLSTALTTRALSSDTGEEILRASLGQVSYFRDLEVQLPGQAAEYDPSSALVGEAAARLTRNWQARAAIQWQPHADAGATEHSALLLQYRDGPKRIANLGYRYQAGLLEQGDMSARWPLSERFHAVARWNYSLRHTETLEAFAGLEYDTCCWAARAIARRYVNDVAEAPENAFFIQLELKGLTSLGDKVDDYLEQGILGYGG